MAKAPSPPSPTHYRLRVKAPIYEAGTQFVPGPTYTVKAVVYEKIRAVTVDVAPIIKD
jgi:hypothetical protein